ncbi:MAG: ImmA/IrrE family metallo-endopeptidase [Gemmataceae bacterium]
MEIAVMVNDSIGHRGHVSEVEGAGAIVSLRPERLDERQAWALAHEIGEMHKDDFFREVGADPDERSSEAAEVFANVFACRLLLPTLWFARDAERLDFDLPALKAIYSSASHEVVAIRTLDLAEPAIVSIWDHGKLTRRQSNVGTLPVSEAERECQAAVHSSGRCRWVRVGEVAARGWPVNEPNWKREILRAIPHEPQATQWT